MSALAIAKLAFELGSELFREWRKERAADKAARQWAETPAPVRGCPQCHEVAYSPGQTTCYKCGARL